MAARVPVLRRHHMREFSRQCIDRRHDLVAARHRQIAAGAEIVLNVDDQKHITVADSQDVAHAPIRSRLHRCALWGLKRIWPTRAAKSAASRQRTCGEGAGSLLRGEDSALEL